MMFKIIVLKSYGDRTATARQPCGDHTMPFDIVCTDNPADGDRTMLFVAEPSYDAVKNYNSTLKPPVASYDV